MPRPAITPEGNRALLFFHPPRYVSPGSDLNSKLYLCRGGNDHPLYVSRRTIANIILNPTKPTPEFATLKERSLDENAELRPAHIPHLDDCYPLHKAAKFVIEFYLRNYNTIPSFLQHLIDPEPVINLSSPVFHLEFDILFLCMATFSNAIQVVNVPFYQSVLILTIFKAVNSDNRSPFHFVSFDPVSCPTFVLNVINLPSNTRFLTWNVRGITRESFVRNFTLIFEVINPSVIILLETRHLLENVTQMILRLPRQFRFLTTPIRSFSGGVAVLWKAEEIQINQHPIVTHSDVINVVVQGTPPPSKKARLGITKPSFKCCGRKLN